MNKLILLFVTLFTAVCCDAQYKNDNILYRTVYTQDLCNELQKQSGYLILDVRSPGEYADTSMMGMNIGRFKDAKNINVRELGQHIAELAAYRNKPVFVYCSHSQRSRRASKMLADSGFTNVININGGMTGILQLPGAGNECVFKQLTTKNNFSMISAEDLCSKLSKNSSKVYVLDVRDDSSYRHISTDARANAYGSFKNVPHMSVEEMQARKGNIPKDKEIVLIDLWGDEATKAAEILKQNNYANVSVLVEGIDRMLQINNDDLSCMTTEYVSPAKFKIISAQQLKSVVGSKDDYLFLDIRSKEEFANKHKNSWQNLGHLLYAVNVPTSDLEQQIGTLEQYKTIPVIVYGFGNSTTTYEAANILVARGFTNVSVLQGGIFNVGWTAANIKGYSSLAALRVDVPAENQ